MFDLLMFYYLMVLIFVGIGGTLAITSDTYVISDDCKVNLLKFIFMYQYAVYKLTEDDFNIAGIILLELLTTLSVWFLNIAIVILICAYYVVMFICKLFYFVFRKR